MEGNNSRQEQKKRLIPNQMLNKGKVFKNIDKNGQFNFHGLIAQIANINIIVKYAKKTLLSPR